MYCLELYVNDKKVALVGREKVENFHTTVTYWGERDFVEVSTGGGRFTKKNIFETFSWGNQNLSTGDTVTIKVIDYETPDNPIEIDEHNLEEGINDLDNKIVEMAAKYRVRAELEGTGFLSEEIIPDVTCCSFCGKEKSEVVKMVSGPSINICNECVCICNDIIEGKEKPPKWPEK